MRKTYYIIDALESFKGHAVSTMTAKGAEEPTTVDYSGGLNFEEYKAKHKRKGLIKLSEAEYLELFSGYCEGLQGKLVEITEAEYWEMFEVLPPLKYTQGIVTYFFVAEAYTGSIHGFYARYKGKYYTAKRCIHTERNKLTLDVMSV